ncbi:glucose-6-phosphate dehydrogenase assembly protein OpcA [Pseudoclavibacter endophyticus]|uniref:Glucose-6-phosphate dehydrogenase assembly protein OpcA n=1 Tax=Pseudoclavibacter endophyticus TaxID=1778590 RepID=A0A6H9WPU2_9MICO|nr:glucose-6-phosphate dehydrogenase assembly protein OpcA [Pseudoclavibacter endophyticus]KAB1650138.1 glucose-6-phosphate dehydrogenase assembly protein OpcA [Pseudoclavibacter endophyticus]GGA56835.1 glucose-6-phosphate dehydrogenase assembly protein OpcA [Pseudoclavibacter endophyticus]
MIIELSDTTTSAISKRLVSVREEGGVVALGRVLTLVISTTGRANDEAIHAANMASGEHPMRVIVVNFVDPRSDRARIDAEIRVGGDAGASDVVILHVSGPAANDPETLVQALLLPDAPVVAWWPDGAVESVSEQAFGRIAQLRITDAGESGDPFEALALLARGYRPGDSDFAWTRLTVWRSQLAAALDQPPYEPVESVEVCGRKSSPATILMAAWLRSRLDVPVLLPDEFDDFEATSGLHAVRLHRPSGALEFERLSESTVRLCQPNQPAQYIPMHRRDLTEVLAEELRSLAPDGVYGDVLVNAVPLLAAEIG